MKKYILIPYANLTIGGVPTKIIDIVNALGKTHPDIVVCILLQKSRADDQRILVRNPGCRIMDFRYPFPLGRRLAYILWLWWNIIRFRPMAILAFLSPYALPVLLAKLLIFWRSFRVVVSEDHYTQTMLDRMVAPLLQRSAIRWLYPHADIIITPTKSLMDQLGKLCQLPKHKTQIVFNWTKFSSVPLSKKRRRWDIVHIGRLVPSKNPYNIAQIMKQYIDKHPKAMCAIIGEGEEVPRIREFIHKHHLEKQLLLRPPVTDVAPYLRQAKTFIFLPEPKTEGFPVVLLEAMACGAIVITKPFIGATEILMKNTTGYICLTQKTITETINQIISSSKTDRILKLTRNHIKKYNSPRNIRHYISAITAA